MTSWFDRVGSAPFGTSVYKLVLGRPRKGAFKRHGRGEQDSIPMYPGWWFYMALGIVIGAFGGVGWAVLMGWLG